MTASRAAANHQLNDVGRVCAKREPMADVARALRD